MNTVSETLKIKYSSSKACRGTRKMLRSFLVFIGYRCCVKFEERFKNVLRRKILQYETAHWDVENAQLERFPVVMKMKAGRTNGKLNDKTFFLCHESFVHSIEVGGGVLVARKSGTL